MLQDVPQFKICEALPHYNISTSAHQKMKKSRDEILKRFTIANAYDRNVRETWIKWFDVYLPLSDDSNEYAEQLINKGAMYIMFNPKTKLKRDLNPYDALKRLNDDSIEWPEIVAYAMPSVTTSFNENPPPPRIFQQRDEAWIESVKSFEDNMQPYFGTTLPELSTIQSLKYILKNTLTYNCVIPTTSGKMYTLSL